MKKVVVFSGNITDMEDIIRKAGQGRAEELKDSIISTLNSWNGLNTEDDLILIRHESKRNPPKDFRGIKTTVKLFIPSNDGNVIEDAVSTVASELSQSKLHCLIVAPPDVCDDVDMDSLLMLWKSLENAEKKKLVSNIGIADVSLQLFKKLYESAEVKPSTIQVDIANCCTVPEELVEFAKLNEVLVLTHNDPHDILGEDVIGLILSRLGLSEHNAEVLWLAYHKTIQVCYGVVHDKGYAIALAVD